jgi:hypothetical protein
VYPTNISAGKQVVISTPEATIKVKAEFADIVETRIIDGTKYILVRADGPVAVNGIEIEI